MPICNRVAVGFTSSQGSHGYWFASPIDMQIVGVSLSALGFAPEIFPANQTIQVITSESDFPFTTYTTELYTFGRQRLVPNHVILSAC